MSKDIRKGRWYFGGLASSAAACITHPMDLIKVILQTQQKKLYLIPLTKKIVREHGILGLYNGISASVLRQMTYSLARFGIYEVGKKHMDTSNLSGKITLASLSGAIGGFVGTPGDMVNVRMQNDVKLPKELRRNYRNAIDGLIQVWKQEGFTNLFSGATTAVSRGLLMTVGQIAFYDQTKALLKNSGFKDDIRTHGISSLCAGAIATTLTQPLDVIKTRMMSAKPGEYKGMWDVIKHISRMGSVGFFKGYIPSFTRLGPHTILTFIFLEQLRMHFGIKPS